MKVFMTGGTGFVGSNLRAWMVHEGHTVTVLTRSVDRKRSFPAGALYLEGDPKSGGEWQQKVAEHDVVLNLAGSSIFRRWNPSVKEAIRESRILTTQRIVEALAARKGKETTLLSTSGVGYYGFHDDEKLDEASPAGDDFLATVSREWEAEALKASEFGVRVVLLRFGIVLGTGGGALKRMIPLFKSYLGSPLGDGGQWFSWIHEQDLAGIYLHLLKDTAISGPVNCTAPNPVRNIELTEVLGQVLSRPTFMPAVPEFVLKMTMGEFGSVLLKGQRAVPRKLMDSGFHFRFPELRGALEDLVG